MATTVATGIRKPRIHGWPPICSGRTVILSYRIVLVSHSPRLAAVPHGPPPFFRASFQAVRQAVRLGRSPGDQVNRHVEVHLCQ
jgi:hypothetical protein